MAKQLNVSMRFNADVTQAKAQIKELQNSLQSLASFNPSVGLDKMNEGLNQGQQAAAKLSVALNQAMNQKTGQLDLTKFNASIKQSGMSLQQYARTLQAMGPAGQQAFNQLAQAISTAEIPTMRLNSLFSSLWTTMKNTARWQISSAVLHGLYGGLQTAFSYAKDLNKSLNNIRIVTGQSADEMARFAVQANKAAQKLSVTTTDYTNAALIYYQQGLRGEDVEKRADVTMKMANVTRQSAEEVSNQLTAIWNNFYDGSESLEYYADILTALGAATASSTDEISQGLEKFAAIANTVGLSYEYATTALATVTAETRQSADVVGTAFKTLFARIQDLELGKTLDDGTTLGKYSQALDKIGVQVQDANGKLRDMDDILNDMGSRWDKIDKATQVAVAQAVGGTRQYAQLIALMDNWDKFQANLTVAKNSEGTLQAQADIYAESWEGATKRVKASFESVISNLINDKTMIKLTNFLADSIKFVDKLIKSIGGLPGILTLVSSLVFKLAAPQVAESFRNIAYNIKSLVVGQKEAIQTQQQIFDLAQQTGAIDVNTASGQAQMTVYKTLAQHQRTMSENADRYTASEKEQAAVAMEILKLSGNQLLDKIAANEKQIEILSKEKEQLDIQREKLQEERQLIIEQEKQKLIAEKRKEIEEEILKLQRQRKELENSQNKIDQAENNQTRFREAAVSNLMNNSETQGDVNNRVELLQSGVSRIAENANSGNYQGVIQKLTEIRQLSQEVFGNTNENSINIIRNLVKAEEEVNSALSAQDRIFSNLNTTQEEGQEAVHSYESGIRILNGAIEENENLLNSDIKIEKGELQTRIQSSKAYRDNADKIEQNTDALTSNAEVMEDVREENKRLPGEFEKSSEGILALGESVKGTSRDWASTLTTIGSAASTLAFTFSSLNSIIDTIKDPDISLYEKFTSILMSIGFLIPSIARGINGIITAKKTWKATEEALLLLQKLENKEAVLQILQNKELTREQQKQKLMKELGYSQEKAETILKAKELVGERYITAENMKQLAIEKLKTAQKIIQQLLTNKIFLIIAAIVVVLGTVLTIIKNYKTEEEKIQENIENYKKSINSLTEKLKETSESVSTLRSDWQAILDSRSKLNSLVKGTTEWKEALIEVNSKVLELINKYPELSQYLNREGEMLFIDEKGYQEILDKQVNESNRIQSAIFLQRGNLIREENKLIREESKKLLKDNDKLLKQYASTFKFGGKTPYKESEKNSSILTGNIIKVDSEMESSLGTISLASPEKIDEILDIFEKGSEEEKAQLIEIIKNTKNEKLIELVTNIDNKMKKQGNPTDEYRNYIKNTLGIGEAATEYYIQEDSSAEKTGRPVGFATEIDAKNIEEYEKNLRQYYSALLSEPRIGQLYGTFMSQFSDYKNWHGQTGFYAGISNGLYNDKGEFISNQDIIDMLVQKSLDEYISAGKEKAEEYGNKYQEEVIKLFKDLDIEISNEQIDKLAAQMARGETRDFSFLSYEQLEYAKKQGAINDEEAQQAVTKKHQEIDKLNQEYLENTQERETNELKSLLEAADMTEEAFNNYAQTLKAAHIAEIKTDEEAQHLAKSQIKLSNGILKLNQAYEKNKDILDSDEIEKDSADYVSALTDMQTALQEWLEVSVDYDKVVEYWENGTLSKAMAGEAEAIAEISTDAAKSMLDSLDIDSTFSEVVNTIDNTIDYIKTNYDGLAFTASADMNVQDAIDGLNDLLKNSQITAEEASRILGLIGYTPKIDWIDSGEVTTAVSEYSIGNVEGETSFAGLLGGLLGSFQVTRKDHIMVPQISGEETYHTDFKPINTPASTKQAAKNNKTTSGSKDRSKKDNKALDEELDRYHYIREVLEDISNELDAVGKAKDRAFGAAKLKNMDKEIALLQKQAAAEKQYLKEIEDYHAQDRKALAEYGATFDEQGRVSNYQSLMKAYVDQYNEGVAKYNAGEIDNDQFQAYENNFQEFKKILGQYEETNNLLEEQKEVLQDYLNAIADARLEKLKYDIEVRIDLKDDDLKLLDHLLNQIEDDAFAAAERIELLGRKAQDNLDKLDVYKKGVEGVLVNKEIAPEDIQAILGGDMSSVEKYRDLFTESDVETLREYAEALMATSEELQEIRKQVAEEVINNFDAWAEKVDKAAKAFEKLNGVLGHYKNIIGLIGKASLGISNDMIKDLNNTAVKNSINQLAASREYLEDLQTQQAEAQKHLDEARKRGIKADIEMWENTVEHINDKVNEVQENMLSNWEATLQKINEIFKENVEMALEDAKKAANGYATFDIMKDQYNKTKEQRKQYLDDYEKMVRLNELNRQISKDIDNTDNIKSQEALRDLQNEINDLQASGVKMSQYDLDYLKKRYELKKAELSIEEAQNTMSTVRLRRDDEGNWGYVYTADQSKIDDAKNSYEQKMLEMRDLSNQHIEEMEEKILEARENMANEIAAIDKTIFDSDEAYMAEVERITNYYQGQIDYYLSEMQKGLDNNNELFDLSAEYYATNYVDPLITGNENFQRSFEDTVLGTVSGGITTTEEYGQTMKTTFEDLLKALNENYNTMASQTSEAMEAAGTSMSTFAGEVATKVKEAGDESDKTKQEVFDLTEEMKKATTETMNWASSWQEQFSPAIEKAKTDVDSMVTAVDKLITTIANLGPIEVKWNVEPTPTIPQPQPSEFEIKIKKVIYGPSGNGSGGNDFSGDVPEELKGGQETGPTFYDEQYHAYYKNGVLSRKESHSIDPEEKITTPYVKSFRNKAAIWRRCKLCGGSFPWKYYTDHSNVWGGCFEKGTEILMADNTFKFIEDIKIGDMVMAYNEESKTYNPKPVLHSFIHHNTIEMIDIYLSNGIRIGMTACHPILTTDGWKSLNYDIALKEHEIETSELKVGQEVIGLINAVVEKIEWRKDIPNYDTYNITVEDDHTYIANGYIVHNMPAQSSAMKLKSGGYTGTWSGRRIVSDFHSPITGATGMYTGEWGDSGRLAVLHQKELVLNAHDTENFLDGIGVLRQITNQIDLNSLSHKMEMARYQMQLDLQNYIGSIGTNAQLDQNVQITAEFPNAVYHDEIEQAFNNLIGLASQYAGRDNK